MKRIRVLAMISSMRGGGSEQQTLLMLRHLDRASFEPHLFLLEKAGALLDRLPDDVVIHDAAANCPTPSVYWPGRMFRRQAAYLESVCQSASIDVIYDRTFRMTLLASAVSVPRVSTIVSPPELAVPLIERRFVGIKRRRLAKAYHESHSVITVSEQAKQSAMQYYGLPAKRIQTIANPVDCDDLENAAAAGQARSRDDSGFRHLVVVGRMSVEKGHVDLMQAIERLDQRWTAEQTPLCIDMIGDGPLRRELGIMADRLKHHRVEFLGRQDQPAATIARADALVLPSHFEGMPNVVLEAMALRTSVIATRSGGTTELEREEPTIWWADPQDPESMASAIQSWIDDPVDAARRVNAASRMIQRHHDVSVAMQKVKACLESATHRS